ncbi:hypothetical protein H5410_023189, partial [Solanum commersonii]
MLNELGAIITCEGIMFGSRSVLIQKGLPGIGEEVAGGCTGNNSNDSMCSNGDFGAYFSTESFTTEFFSFNFHRFRKKKKRYSYLTRATLAIIIVYASYE